MMQHIGWETTALAFLAGALSFFSPCVAPLVPGYIGYLSGTATLEGAGGTRSARRSSVTSASLGFVAGFSAGFVVLGLVTATLGRLIAAYQPVLETVAGIVMIVMGAFLLNLLPRGLTYALMGDRRLHLSPQRAGALRAFGPFALGLVFAAGWTPCVGPVLTAILLYVGATADRTVGIVLLAVYALGFAMPFLAVGLGWSAGLGALGWFKRHGRLVTMVSGVALIIVGLVYLSGQVQVFAIWAQRLGLVGPSLP